MLFNHISNDDLEEKNLNFIEKIFFLCFFCIPLKFFTFKIETISLGFTRILMLLLIPIFIFHFFQKIKDKQSLLINPVYFNKYCFILFIYAAFSYLISILIYDGQDLSSRIHLSSLSFFESFFIIPFLFFILVPSPKRQLKILQLVFKWLKIVILIAFIQFLMDLGGLSVSYERFGEPAPENRGVLFGLDVLRVNSFFGEPRGLAVCLIPIYLLNKIYLNDSFKIIDILIIFTIGVLTLSSSFILTIIVYLLIWSLFISPKFRIFSVSFFASIVLLYLINFDLIKDFLIEIIPRFEIVFEILSPDVISNIAEISPEFKAQISDVSLVGYILNGEIIKLSGLFGNGLGSGHFAIDQIASSYFNLQNDGTIYGSRWLFYTMLLEIGVIGLALFYLNLKTIFNNTSSRLKKHKLYIMIFFALSLLSSVYFFVLLSVYLSIEYKATNLNNNNNKKFQNLY